MSAEDAIAKGRNIFESGKYAPTSNGHSNYQDPYADVPPPMQPPYDDDRTEKSPKPKSFLDQLLSLTDLANLPAVEPLVDGLLYRNTLAQLSGPPGSYKSFISVGLSCAVASGQSNWVGHRIPHREKVVYVAAEGVSGLRARILSCCERTPIDPAELDGWLHVLPLPVQLGKTVDVALAIEMVHAIGAGLLVLDTRARCTLGLEENSATEQGHAVESADRIRAVAGCTVWGIHHTGRNGSSPRGSTAWDGAVWSDLRLTSERSIATISVEKHKDAASDKTFEYRLLPHTVSDELMPGLDEDARKSLVVIPTSGGNLDEIPTEVGKKVGTICGNSCGIEGLTRSQLVTLCVESGIPKTTVYRVINDLIARHFLQSIGDGSRRRYIWTAPEEQLW